MAFEIVSTRMCMTFKKDVDFITHSSFKIVTKVYKNKIFINKEYSYLKRGYMKLKLSHKINKISKSNWWNMPVTLVIGRQKGAP